MTGQASGAVPSGASGGLPGEAPRQVSGGAPGQSADQAPDAAAVAMRVVTGSPTDGELAAAHSVIIAVLTEQASRGAALLEPPVDLWKRSGRAMRTPLTPGSGAWRAAGEMRG